MRQDGSMTSVELMTGLGHIYGFEVRGKDVGVSLQEDRPDLAELLADGNKDDGPGAAELTTEEGNMPKKKCKNGCGKQAATPEDTCYACYKTEHGHSYNTVKPRKVSGGATL
jgi:hypothetical protein